MLLSAVSHLHRAVESILTDLKLPQDHPAMTHLAAATEQVEQAWTRHGMVVIPAGELLMGSSDKDELAVASEKPQHSVYLDAFAIDVLPVTVAQYRDFCRVTGHAMPPEPIWGWRDDHPVVNVNWFDAFAYANWVGKRLPTEAEWEKAARGADGRLFPWGDTWDPSRGHCLKGDQLTGTAPVGSYPAGASSYGVLDLAGNIWEWCADWYDPYYYLWAPRRNPPGPETSHTRVLRGGSWRCNVPGYLRCAYRNFNRGPATWYNDRGFRCAITLQSE
jgi:formylglycine-generating enzyme required for sulfatase activity